MEMINHIEEGREKKRAALLSVGSALLLVSLKTFLVVRTGSLGVLSEALHSGLDLLAAIITFLSVRMSDQPADEKHRCSSAACTSSRASPRSWCC